MNRLFFTMGDYVCVLKPLFYSPKRIEQYVIDSRFDDFVDMEVVGASDYALFSFNSLDRARMFADEFDGRIINGYKITAYVARTQERRERPDRDSRPPRTTRPNSSQVIRSKTIAVKNFPLDRLNDRNLWDNFRESGFIRSVETRFPVGYVKFDTEEDAVRAYEDMDGRIIYNSKLTVEIVPDRVLGLPNLGVQLTAESEKDVE